MHTEETINKMKRQSMEQQAIFVNRICDKRLIPKMYKELEQLNGIKKDGIK